MKINRCFGGSTPDAGVKPDGAPVVDAGQDAATVCDGAACKPGATRCAGKEVQTCNASGCGWSPTTSCPCACVGGACTGPLCTVGAKRCQISSVETCDGCVWKQTEACICGCTGDAPRLASESVPAPISQTMSMAFVVFYGFRNSLDDVETR